MRLSIKEAKRLGIETPNSTTPKKREMNHLELDYRDYLERQRHVGEILDYRFEWFRFILYHGLPGEQREASYKMDFLVVKPAIVEELAKQCMCDNSDLKQYTYSLTQDLLEIHEVKGHWRSRDRIRFKVAAEMNPWFRFLGVMREHGEWIYERF